MSPEAVLAQPPRVLTQDQREAYFERGYVLVENAIDADWLARLNAITDEFVDRSRAVGESGRVYDIAPGHSAERPQLRRLKRPDEQHPLYWQLASGVLADIAADLLGPDVRFHHSKLNFKWNDGRDDVRWHQDAQFYPHTNYGVLAIGAYLVDVTMDNGPLTAIPGSHNGPLYDQYDEQGNWAGCLRRDDVAGLPLERAEHLLGPAGSVTIHNCRTVHSSPPSRVASGRPLLINAYTAADAFAYTPHPDPSAHTGELVRGQPARWAEHDPRPCQIPPDWSGGYTSIYAAQESVGKDRSAA